MNKQNHQPVAAVYDRRVAIAGSATAPSSVVAIDRRATESRQQFIKKDYHP